MDFSKEKLTERNKENSFLDVDWIISELINYGHERQASSDVPNTPTPVVEPALLRTSSLKNVTKMKKKVREHNRKMAISCPAGRPTFY